MRIAVLAVTVLLAGVAGATARGAASVYLMFKTPSGNIGCGYASIDATIPASLRCDIRSGLKPSPLRPQNCDLDFGDSMAMRKTGLATYVCHGDTVLDPRARVLAYGKTWARDGFKCLSQTTGLRCSNLSGHGFFLSRERSYRF